MRLEFLIESPCNAETAITPDAPALRPEELFYLFGSLLIVTW
jgi:hypothetical protein